MAIPKGHTTDLNDETGFEPKRAKKEESGGFGTNARKRKKDLWTTVGDLKMMVEKAESKLKKAERKNAKMKTAIRKVVSVKRDIKGSLAVLTDGDCLLPRYRNVEIKELDDQGLYDVEGIRIWSASAFNATPEDECLVIKVPKANRTHFMCDFCDGDELDKYEWLEGNFKQDLSIRELLEYRRGRTRSKRRAISDPLAQRTQERVLPCLEWELRPENELGLSYVLDEYQGSSNSDTKESDVESFRKKVPSYKSKPSLNDLFTSERRRKYQTSSESESSGNEDKSSCVKTQKRKRTGRQKWKKKKVLYELGDDI